MLIVNDSVEIFSEQPEDSEKIVEPKKDALAEAMLEVGSVIFEEVADDGINDNNDDDDDDDDDDEDGDDDTGDKSASSDGDAATSDVEMDDAIESAGMTLTSAPAAVVNSAKTAKAPFPRSEKPKGTAAVPAKKRRDDGWFNVGTIKETSCNVTSYFLPYFDRFADPNAEHENVVNKHPLEVGCLIGPQKFNQLRPTHRYLRCNEASILGGCVAQR